MSVAATRPSAPAKQDESQAEKFARYRSEANDFTPTSRGTRDEINQAKLNTYKEWQDVRKRA